MEEMIQYILNMDKTARELTEKAEAKKADAKSGIPARKEKLRKEFLERAEKRVEIMREEEKMMLNQRIAAKRKEYEKAAQNLEEMYIANKECWLQDIVSHVTEYHSK